MRNYVKINGVSSLTLLGLAIKLLPPIVKPPKRTTIEEIDGRSGDIITELGYGAYDKQMEIGLYDGYDIDKIIAFFNSKGTIEFSNESGKLYNFAILDQIDFESLLRFRQATVTFHVQPFKYPDNESPIVITTNSAQTIVNGGNIYSKPLIALEGTGEVEVYLGGNQIFQVDMTNVNKITIDTEKMEAYNTTDNTLANREVLGDYDKFVLDVGNNSVKVDGTFTKATITRYKRWL